MRSATLYLDPNFSSSAITQSLPRAKGEGGGEGGGGEGAGAGAKPDVYRAFCVQAIHGRLHYI